MLSSILCFMICIWILGWMCFEACCTISNFHFLQETAYESSDCVIYIKRNPFLFSTRQSSSVHDKFDTLVTFPSNLVLNFLWPTIIEVLQPYLQKFQRAMYHHPPRNSNGFLWRPLHEALWKRLHKNCNPTVLSCFVSNSSLILSRSQILPPTDPISMKQSGLCLLISLLISFGMFLALCLRQFLLFKPHSHILLLLSTCPSLQCPGSLFWFPCSPTSVRTEPPKAILTLTNDSTQKSFFWISFFLFPVQRDCLRCAFPNLRWLLGWHIDFGFSWSSSVLLSTWGISQFQWPPWIRISIIPWDPFLFSS